MLSRQRFPKKWRMERARRLVLPWAGAALDSRIGRADQVGISSRDDKCGV